MKHFLLSLMLLAATPAARGQLLPIPGTRNPDWKLEKTEPRGYILLPDTLPHSQDAMPNAAPRRPGPTDPMPNAARKSISGIGNRRYHWDAERRLRYEWRVQPGSEAPDGTVTVRADDTSTAYTFRRRPKPAAQPYYQLDQPIPAK